jgi:hypothetical protein
MPAMPLSLAEQPVTDALSALMPWCKLPKAWHCETTPPSARMPQPSRLAGVELAPFLEAEQLVSVAPNAQKPVSLLLQAVHDVALLAMAFSGKAVLKVL